MPRAGRVILEPGSSPLEARVRPPRGLCTLLLVVSGWACTESQVEAPARSSVEAKPQTAQHAPQASAAESTPSPVPAHELLRQAEELAQRGESKLAAERYGQASAAYEAVWRARPPNGPALVAAGHCASQEGQAARAQRLYDRALRELEREAGRRVEIETRTSSVSKHISSPKLVAWSARGDQLAVGTKNEVRLVSTDAPEPKVLLTSKELRKLVFSARGAFLVTGAEDGRLEMWSALDGTLLWSVPTARAAIAGIALTTSEESVLTASTDGFVRAWRLDDGHELPGLGEFGSGGGLADIAVSANGRLVALAGATYVFLWDLTKHRQVGQLGPHPRPPRTVALSDDGTLVASTALDGKTRVWRRSDGALLQVLPGNELFLAASRFLPKAANTVVTSSTRLRYWQPETGKLLKVFGEAKGGEMAFAPDASAVATVTRPSFASIWDAETGKLQRKVPLSSDGEPHPAPLKVCRIGKRVFAFELCQAREAQ